MSRALEEDARSPRASVPQENENTRRPFLRKGQGLARFKKGGSTKRKPSTSSSTQNEQKNDHVTRTEREPPQAEQQRDVRSNVGRQLARDQQHLPIDDGVDTLSDSSFRVSRAQYDSKKLQEKRELEEFRLLELQAKALKTPEVSPQRTTRSYAAHDAFFFYEDVEDVNGREVDDTWTDIPAHNDGLDTSRGNGAVYPERSDRPKHRYAGYVSEHGGDESDNGSAKIDSHFDDAETWDDPPSTTWDGPPIAAATSRAHAWENPRDEGMWGNGDGNHGPSQHRVRQDRSPPPQSKIVAKLFRQRQVGSGAHRPGSKGAEPVAEPAPVKSPARSELDESVDRRIGTVCIVDAPLQSCELLRLDLNSTDWPQLEKEIAKFKAENERMNTMREAHETAARDLARDKAKFEKEMERERELFKEQKQVRSSSVRVFRIRQQLANRT